jgi:hypothetical protein
MLSGEQTTANMEESCNLESLFDDEYPSTEAAGQALSMPTPRLAEMMESFLNSGTSSTIKTRVSSAWSAADVLMPLNIKALRDFYEDLECELEGRELLPRGLAAFQLNVLRRCLLLLNGEVVRERLPRLQARLTERAQSELSLSNTAPWAVDDAIMSIRSVLRESGRGDDVTVDAIMDSEMPGPPTIALTVQVGDIGSEERFELWNRLASLVEDAAKRWKPDRRIAVVVKRGSVNWMPENSTDSQSV